MQALVVESRARRVSRRRASRQQCGRAEGNIQYVGCVCIQQAKRSEVYRMLGGGIDHGRWPVDCSVLSTDRWDRAVWSGRPWGNRASRPPREYASKLTEPTGTRTDALSARWRGKHGRGRNVSMPSPDRVTTRSADGSECSTAVTCTCKSKGTPSHHLHSPAPSTASSHLFLHGLPTASSQQT